MARTSTKKSKSKKSTKKSPGKVSVKGKKSASSSKTARTVKKSAPAKKSAVVKKKTAARKTAVAKKKTTPKKVSKKSTDTKQKQKRTMAKRTKKKEEKIENVKAVQVESTAEARAKAMENIKGYSKADLEHFREIILEKRDEIIEQLQNLKDQMLDPTTGEYINENSPYSLHMAEQGTDAMEREKTFLYAQRENKFLGYLEDALKRIDAGTYGICIECIDEPQHLCDTCPLIPKARLEAVPHSQLCLPIKQHQEKK
jgi:DnaK suppressor protein